jgi:hypothetical protein
MSNQGTVRPHECHYPSPLELARMESSERRPALVLVTSLLAGKRGFFVGLGLGVWPSHWLLEVSHVTTETHFCLSITVPSSG